MGVKPSQGELNAAIKPLIVHIPQAQVIDNDIIMATNSVEEMLEVIYQVLEAFHKAGLLR